MRQDIPLAQQIVQSSHASIEAARRYIPKESKDVPYVVLVGVPDKAALFRVERKLRDGAVGHAVFYEPDGNMGLSAVATEPLGQGQRRLLSNYRVWRAENTTHVEPRRPSKDDVCSRGELVGIGDYCGFCAGDLAAAP